MPFRHLCFQVATFLVALAVQGQEPAGTAGGHAPQIVIVPTIGNDHQFNLDYTVAHLAALLDKIEPDALIVDDYTDWLRRDCPWNAIYPEIHVALEYRHQRSITIFGLSDSPTTTFDTTSKNLEAYNKRYSDPKVVAREVRGVLDRGSSRIAREYSFATNKTDLPFLLQHFFPQREKKWPQERHEWNDRQGQRRADQIERVNRANQAHRRWAVLQPWEQAGRVERLLADRSGIRPTPVGNYLPLSSDAIAARMDIKHTAWILSGLLDEWWGMWAPQTFNGTRIRELLSKLKELSPDDPSTLFLEARWSLANRDFEAATSHLKRLVAMPDDATFPFPMNGKWIRPPWRSVRDKSKLNLAFVHDYQGEREKALALYRELLQKGAALNDDARALGYTYDDIQSVIQSYTERPYSGMPNEAFRHLLTVAQRPRCMDGSRRD